MDFIVGFPVSSHCHDAIMVTVDRLTKVTHFAPIRSSYIVVTVARVSLEGVVRLHGIPRWIISYCDPVFTSKFWTTLHHDLGTQLNLSLTYHPKTDGQIERVNQVSKDTLRMHVMDQ